MNQSDECLKNQQETVEACERSLPFKLALGVQMLFVAFGALVLVPILTGLDPNIALFTAGAGTLLFHLITGGSVPIFLASSFAFIAPIKYGIANFGTGATLGGLAAVGLVYVGLSLLARFGGAEAIRKYMPPVVTGPVIMVIGLKLAPISIQMAKSFDGSGNADSKAMIVSAVALFTAIGVVTYGKKMLSLIPVLCGVAAGYLVSAIMGVIDYSPILQAAWFVNPWTSAMAAGRFAWPVFDLAAILYMLPVAIAPAIEHVGDILAISSVTGKDFIKAPGLHRTLLGDGLATSLAALVGGPPNTTYSEVTGAVALTKAFNPVYMRIAAVTAILLSFIGKLGAVLQTIPTPVMGGIMVLLFGMIASIGMRSLISSKTDLSRSRNLIIVSLILVIGIGDMTISYGRFQIGGIGLCGIIGLILNVMLPDSSEEGSDPN
ncbi:MAG: uracil-xanthine permease family protein [Candidatus Riflebacteria bacterium]|nr:uracil-xanthine permease family protein [Candidatus Riflebacteria bacterium]